GSSQWLRETSPDSLRGGRTAMLKYAKGARRRVFLSSLFCATGLGLVGLAAAPAAAQGNASATSSEATGGNEIIVSAQLRNQNVQDVPLSITAVSGEMLEARSQTNLTQIENQTPSLLLQQNPAG